jgi:hypothetical protein
MEPNPYQTPESLQLPPPLISNAEAIRREHINCEANAKTLGALYILGGAILLIAGAFGVVNKTTELGIIEFGINVILGISFLILGLALRKLQPAARIIACILAGIGLLAFPIGTAIGIVILVSFVGAKGSLVFSPQYKEIIAATPHVKVKTSIVVKILLGIFLALIVAGIAIALLSKPSSL